MDNIIKDFKFGVRSLIGKPTYSFIALLTLMLGMGVTITMFSLVNSIVFKPLPLPQSEQLYEMSFETRSQKSTSFSFRGYETIRDADTPFQSVSFAAYNQGVVLLGDQFIPLRLVVSSYDYFEVFKTPALLGRWYSKSDTGKKVVVLSYIAWVQYFEQRQDIIGQAITMNKQQFIVIGVMPAGFSDSGTTATHLWSVIESLNRPGFLNGRLKNGLTLARAQQQSGAINRILNQNSDQKNGAWKVSYRSLKDKSIEDIKTPLILLSLALIAVFVIAILNVLNLSFAHYGNRTHELSVRASMGATRKRLIQQLLVESFLLSLTGGILGLLMAAWALELVKVLGADDIPRIHEIGLDVSTILITGLLILAAACITALLPAFALINPYALSRAMQDSGSKSTGSKNSQRIRRWLVSAEVSAAVVLLIAAGLLLRSYVKLIDVEPGFNPQNVVAGHVWLPDNFGSKSQQLQHWQSLIEQVTLHPDVLSVAGTSTLPMSTTGINYDVTYSHDEASVATDGAAKRAAARTVSENYFDVLEIPLLEGRAFGIQDQQGSEQVVIINRALADTLWKEGSPVGRKLLISQWENGVKTIVGIVGNVKHMGLRSEEKPEFYAPLSQQIYPGMSLISKVKSGKSNQVLKFMGQTASQLEGAAPLILPAKMEDMVAVSIKEEKIILQLVSVFSVLAIVLASIGVYGVSDNLVSQRTNEIGVRMALGARPSVILKWVLLNGLKPVIYGAAFGVVLALALVQILTKVLFEVSSLDPITYLLVPCILVLVGAIATWLPARRATRIHPQQALHYE